MKSSGTCLPLTALLHWLGVWRDRAKKKEKKRKKTSWALDSSVVITRGRERGKKVGGTNGDGWRLGGVSAQHSVRTVCYRTVRLKPVQFC